MHVPMQNEVWLIREGEKVGASESALLNMLNIQPFTYGLAIVMVYESGAIFEPRVLDITSDDLRNKLVQVRLIVLFVSEISS